MDLDLDDDFNIDIYHDDNSLKTLLYALTKSADNYLLLERPEIQEWILSNGYDGFYTIESGYGVNIAVYSNKQIKSVNNNGDWSDSDNIFEQFTNYKDEFEKEIVWDNGEYKIAVSDLEDPTRISLWYDDKNIGNMYLSSEIFLDEETYTKVNSIEIDSNHRGKGLGKKLYQVALKYITTDGIASYLADRVNKNQVPSIYKSLNGFEKDGYNIIPKGEKKESEEIVYKDPLELSSKYNVKPTLISMLIRDLTYEERVNRRSRKSLNSFLKDTIEFAINYEDLKPRDYGYGRRKAFQEDLEKLSNITLDDLTV
jgi:GNAT superfamily N-acetyltransferase